MEYWSYVSNDGKCKWRGRFLTASLVVFVISLLIIFGLYKFGESTGRAGFLNVVAALYAVIFGIGSAALLLIFAGIAHWKC